MRIFRGTVFLGSGEHSVRACEALHARLEDALSALSGRQQSRSDDEAELNQRAEIEMEEVVRDIASALLGREIALTDVQPYPPGDGAVIHTYWEKKREAVLNKLREANVPLPEACECTPAAVYRLLHCRVHQRAAYRPYASPKAS